jgi:hypothetical protein
VVNELRTVALGLTIAILGPGAIPADAAGPMKATLVLTLIDYSGTPARELARAEQEAARIYADAGLLVQWESGELVGDRVEQANGKLRVILLPRDMTKRKTAAEAIGDTVLGRGSRESGRAYIFVDRIVDLAVRARVEVSRILGRVIAHEVGHVLLTESGHSATGILAATIETRPIAQRFTNAQRMALGAPTPGTARR